MLVGEVPEASHDTGRNGSREEVPEVAPEASRGYNREEVPASDEVGGKTESGTETFGGIFGVAGLHRQYFPK